MNWGCTSRTSPSRWGVHPKTVSRALARGTVPSGERTKRGSKLDAYKATVDRLLGEGVWNAVVIHREIETEGYTGGITTLRVYINPKRSLRAKRQLETPIVLHHGRMSPKAEVVLHE